MRCQAMEQSGIALFKWNKAPIGVQAYLYKIPNETKLKNVKDWSYWYPTCSEVSKFSLNGVGAEHCFVLGDGMANRQSLSHEVTV